MTGLPSTPPLEDLLAEEPFVRRLARGLLFDEHRVDDVVQQTWVAALRHPPVERRALRSWLRRVVRGVAGNLVRSEVRRRHRERAAAVEEGLPSVDDVLSREARRQEVLQALLGVPEPYRDTVVLRYFEDLSPQQIAARLELPPGTVRSRLKRGLDMLRERLDRAHGGDRRAWCLGLIPLARPGRVAAGMAGTSILGGWLAMKKPLMSGAALLLVALLTVYASTTSGAEGPPPPGTPPAVAGLDEATDPGTGGPSRRALTGGEGEPPPAPRITETDLSGFRGRLLLPGGVPAPGHRVRIAGIDGLTLFTAGPELGGDDEGLHLVSGETVTGADGRFLVAGLWPRAMYVLEAGHGGAHPTFRPLARTPGPGEVIDLGDVVLDQKATFTGRVVDPGGAPVAGAEVWAADVPALLVSVARLDRLRPGAGGMLLLPVPERGEDAAAFAARLRGYLGSTLFRETGLAPDEGHAVLVLDGTEWLERVHDLLPVARTRTDGAGRFTLHGIAEGRNMVVARHRGFAGAVRQGLRAEAGRERDLGDLELRRGEVYAGEVVDAGGRTVPGAEVRVASIGPLGFTGVAFAEPAVRCDADGRFALEGLPRGRLLVAARRGPGAPWWVGGVREAGEGDVLELPQEHRVEVVLDPGEADAPEDLRVRLLEGPILGELTRAGLQPRVDLDGRMHRAGRRLELRGLHAGVYTLQVEAGGFARTAVSFHVPRTEPLSVDLEPASPFTVVATDTDGRPVPGAGIYVHRSGTPAWTRPILPTSYGLPRWEVLPHRAGSTDGEGRLEVDGFPAGDVVVNVLHPRMGQAGSTARLPADEVRLTLEAAATVEGVLTEKGRTVGAGEYRLVAVHEDGDLPSGMPRPFGQAVPGPDGSFRIAGLAPGPWRLEVAEPLAGMSSLGDLVEMVRDRIFSFFQWSSHPERTVILAPGEVRRVTFEIDPEHGSPGASGTVRGVVAIEGVDPRTLVVVEETGFGGVSGLEPVPVAADGTFVHGGLEEGRHELGVQSEADAGSYWTGTVEVRAGEETFLRIERASVPLRGRVVPAGGHPPEELRVVARGTLEDGARCTLRTGTDEQGVFTFDAALPGTYRIEAAGSRAAGRVDGVTVALGRSPEVEVPLQPRFVLSGRVVWEGTAPESLAIGVSWVEGRGRSSSFYGLGDGMTFRITGLAPRRYRILLMAGSSMYRGDPGEVVLRDGDREGLVVRRGAERK